MYSQFFFGAHYKRDDGIQKIDHSLGGLVTTLGMARNRDWEFTAVATKTIADVLPKPIIVSGGLRYGRAIHTGLVGFARDYKTTVEAGALFFVTDKLLAGAEYR